ncbi:hypothetical protein AKJ16_DCAP08779 [Drosera capensis]
MDLLRENGQVRLGYRNACLLLFSFGFEVLVPTMLASDTKCTTPHHGIDNSLLIPMLSGLGHLMTINPSHSHVNSISLIMPDNGTGSRSEFSNHVTLFSQVMGS